MRIYKLILLSASVTATALVAHCGSNTQGTCEETATCPPDASDGPPPVVCDTTKDPKDQAGCLDSRVGIFVDGAGGNDANAGSKSAPVKTIAKGLSLAPTSALTRIYVCEGTYAEDVTIDASVDGVSIYGGYACGTWSYSGNKPQIGASNSPMRIDSTTKAITIEDVLVKAADATTPGASSVAAFANAASGGVTLVRVNLTAGKGMAGASGVAGNNYSASLAQSDSTIAGHNATGAAGGALQMCTGLCVDSITSTGGQGGVGGAAPSSGSGGAPALGGGQAGTSGQACGSGGSGTDGAAATTAGTDGTAPAKVGTLTVAGWAPAPGSSGTNGTPGQGGGGGAGATATGAGGGAGGGCGGCGGGGAVGGGGGGASIALLVGGSSITLVNSELHASDAGAGGSGGAGQDGQLGGYSGNQSNPGCVGGNGGKGASGGKSAGGAGGVSVGILYTGGAPNADGATSAAITIGSAGTKGTGGNAGQNDGIDGVAQAVLQAP